MSDPSRDEIASNVQRAEQSIQAAQALLEGEFYDFAASRAYYAAFYAASAVLLSEGIELSKHSAVIAAIHQRVIRPGRLSKELGKGLNWLFEIRSVGDYGGVVHVTYQQAAQAIHIAAEFLLAVKSLLQR